MERHEPSKIRMSTSLTMPRLALNKHNQETHFKICGLAKPSRSWPSLNNAANMKAFPNVLVKAQRRDGFLTRLLFWPLCSSTDTWGISLTLSWPLVLIDSNSGDSEESELILTLYVSSEFLDKLCKKVMKDHDYCTFPLWTYPDFLNSWSHVLWKCGATTADLSTKFKSVRFSYIKGWRHPFQIWPFCHHHVILERKVAVSSGHGARYMVVKHVHQHFVQQRITTCNSLLKNEQTEALALGRTPVEAPPKRKHMSHKTLSFDRHQRHHA